MTARPKIHGGYTLDRGTGLVSYWTCGHGLRVAATVVPPLDCAQCAEMTVDALAEFIRSRKLDIEVGV